MKEKIKKQEKGITLIALVITIIVLLILAGVAISMLSGENGILNRASEAKTQTDKKSEEEQVKLAATEAMITSTDYTVTESTLNDALKGQFGDGKYELNPISNGWEVIINKTQNHYTVAGDGSSSYMKWYYKEDPNNKNRRTIITNGEIELKVGDYINYNSAETTESTEKTTYISPTGTTTSSTYAKAEENPTQGSGYSDTQEFNGKAYTGKWKVLGVDEKTGEILIVSADTVQTTAGSNYYLKGFTGAQYGEKELNNICKTYGYGTGASGARSINVDDVNKLTGYNPNNTGVYDVAQTGSGTKYNAGEINEYGNKVTYKWTTTENSIQATSNVITPSAGSSSYYATNGFNWYDGSKWRNSMQNTSSPVTITTLTSNIYRYYSQTLTTDSSTEATTGIATDSAEYKTVFCNNEGTNVSYWLASPYVLTRSRSARFGMRSVNSSGCVDSNSLYDSNGNVSSPSYEVRPVVSLKSDIKLSGSSVAGWTIQK